jgi:uncharacterized membrane protein (UPF0127 family)
METRKIFINDVPITVEVADTEELRQDGLMHRLSLPEGQGMLFVFEQVGTHGFWMKNTHIPLSVAFISACGKINKIAPLYPHDHSTTSEHDVQCALEVPQGFFKKHNIKVGDVVEGIRGTHNTLTEHMLRRIVRSTL